MRRHMLIRNIGNRRLESNVVFDSGSVGGGSQPHSAVEQGEQSCAGLENWSMQHDSGLVVILTGAGTIINLED